MVAGSPIPGHFVSGAGHQQQVPVQITTPNFMPVLPGGGQVALATAGSMAGSMTGSVAGNPYIAKIFSSGSGGPSLPQGLAFSMAGQPITSSPISKHR